MQKYSLLAIFFLLGACHSSIKNNEENITPFLKVDTEVIAPQVLKVTLQPQLPLPGRIYSLTIMKGDVEVVLPLPKKVSKEEKDKVILIALEETYNSTLVSPFYKKSISKDILGQITEIDPLLDNPIRDKDNNPIGSNSYGVIYFMSKNTGEGIVYTNENTGEVKYTDEKYEFYIHFNTQTALWKLLVGIVRVDIFNPSLEHVVITSPFNILNKDKEELKNN